MVLVWLLAFFGVVAGVNALMIRLAISTFGGVETANAYQAGLAFAREIAAAESQNARHWRVDTGISTAGAQTSVDLTARDADDRPLANVSATGKLTHPTDMRADRILSFDPAGGGNSGRAPARCTDNGSWKSISCAPESDCSAPGIASSCAEKHR